jgi:hypothetical protein
MKLKRLKHQSHVLCHMFCGWKLYPDWEKLAELGDGALEIDVLSQTCKFNGVEIPGLVVAGAMRDWLLQDLQANRIALENIKSARLTVHMRAGFDKRTKLLNRSHDFLLEGIIVGNGREFKTTLAEREGVQRIIET